MSHPTFLYPLLLLLVFLLLPYSYTLPQSFPQAEAPSPPSPALSPVPSVTPLGNLTRLCQPCGRGKYAPPYCGYDNGPNSTKVCAKDGECAAGHPLLNCTQCPPGSANGRLRQTACELCIPGSFAQQPGRAVCEDCRPGGYCPNKNMTAPIPCPVFSYCPGYGVKIPVPCPPGYTCSREGTVDPISCPAGFYCRNGQSTGCPEDHECAGGNSSPTKCLWLFDAPPISSQCHPTAGFFIVMVIGVALFIILGIVLWVRLSKKMADKEERNRSDEITGLIPRADGPTYNGL